MYVLPEIVVCVCIARDSCVCSCTAEVVVCVCIARGMEQFIRSHQEVVVSARDGDGNSVLHLAAANNYLDLVALVGEKVRAQ